MINDPDARRSASDNGQSWHVVFQWSEIQMDQIKVRTKPEKPEKSDNLEESEWNDQMGNDNNYGKKLEK